MEILHRIMTALSHLRKIEVVLFLIFIAVLVIALFKFYTLAKSKNISSVDFLYFVRGSDGKPSPTRTLSYITMGFVGYMDIKFVDHTNVIWALGLHLLYVLVLQGLVKAVDLVALKNGTTVSTSSTSIVSKSETIVTPDAPVTP